MPGLSLVEEVVLYKDIDRAATFFETIVSRQATICYAVLATIGTLLLDAIHTNVLPFLAVTIAGVASRIFMRYAEAWFFIAAATFASSFVFAPTPFDYHVIHRADGTVTYHDGFEATPFNPLSDRVRNFSRTVTVKLENFRGSWSGHACEGTTIDNVGIRALTGAEFRLEFTGLLKAYVVAHSRHELASRIEEELCKRFAATVGQYTINQLPAPIILAAGMAADTLGINDLGVIHQGYVGVANLHIVKKQNK